MKTATFKLSGLHCVTCALTIDVELEDMIGIKESKTNYAKSILQVMYNENIITIQKIIQLIKQLGYCATYINDPA